MKIIKYITISLTMSAFTFGGICQDINLDYANGSVTMPLDPTVAMSIDATNGNVNITTTNTAETIGLDLGLQPTGDAPNIQFNVTSTGTSSANINATITNEAVYCNKSGLWSGLYTSNPPNTFVTSVTGGVSSNGTSYTLTCANSYGKRTLSATVTSISTVINPVVTISASATSVDSGENSTISWTVANAPDSCTFDGDWPSGTTFTKDGPFSFVETNITLAKTYSVICENTAGNSGTKTISVTVNGQNANVWPSCQGANAYVLNGNEDRTILANGTSSPSSYAGLYAGLQGFGTSFDWPNFGADIHLSLEKNKYIAAKFNTGNTGFDAKFVLSGTGNFEGQTPAAARYVISLCPGSFNADLGARCSVGGGSLFWSSKTNPGGPDGYFCELQKNTTYYLNMIHSDNSEGNGYATSDCDNDYCGILAKQAAVSF